MPTLAELDVQLILKGAEMVQKGLAGVKDQAGGADKGLTKVKDSTAGASKGMEGLTKVAGVANAAFNTITGTLLGFVRAGLAGTVQGAVLQQQWMFLSREVATMFLPTIETAIDYIGKATDWFRHLSVEQQDNYRKWTLIGLGTLGVVAALPKVVSAGKAVISTFNAMGVAGSSFALVAVGIAVVAREMYKLNEELQESERRMKIIKEFGITKKEFEKNPANEVLADPEVDKAQRKKMAEEQIAEAERLQNQIRKRQGIRTITGSGFLVAAATALGIGGNPQKKEQEALEELEKRKAAARHALLIIEGKDPKFARDAEEEKKKRGQLAMLPTHGFTDFLGKFQHVQIAASTEDPNKKVAANTEEILKWLRKLPFPIIR